VISLKDLPPHPAFVRVKDYGLPMTWSSNVTAHLYRRA
jgi:hypothetical protein